MQTKKKIKPRRKLQISDFRKELNSEYGYIDIQQINRAFPNPVQRSQYIHKLILAMET